MAKVYLTAAELKGMRPLPKRCLVCGAKPARLIENSFSYNAGQRWSPMAGYQTKFRYLTASVPLCKEHENYFTKWQYRLLYLIIGVIGLFVGLIVISVLAALLLGGNAVFVIVPVALIAVLSLFGFIAYAMVSSSKGVHTNLIDKKGMRLVNVADDFADALDALREEQGEQQGEEEEEVTFDEFGDADERRPRRGRPRDDDYDDEEDERPRRRRSRRRDDAD
ncbi:MAG: hypothetical protein FJ271_27295 [Planctomycetes bacterium]|nr:hypothetical protein [Planctomycetota bacterium]